MILANRPHGLHDFTPVQYIKYFIYHFTFIPHGLIRTHKWPAPNISGFIAQLVWASHRYHDLAGSNPVEVLKFSVFYICNCINCIHNCEDHSLHKDYVDISNVGPSSKPWSELCATKGSHSRCQLWSLSFLQQLDPHDLAWNQIFFFLILLSWDRGASHPLSDQHAGFLIWISQDQGQLNQLLHSCRK